MMIRTIGAALLALSVHEGITYKIHTDQMRAAAQERALKLGDQRLFAQEASERLHQNGITLCMQAKAPQDFAGKQKCIDDARVIVLDYLG